MLVNAESVTRTHNITQSTILFSFAGRLASLDRQITEKEKNEIREVAGGRSLKEIINGLLDTIDADKKVDKAREIFETEEPSEKQVKEASNELVKIACAPFDQPKFRNTIMDMKKRSEQVVDTVSRDEVVFAGFDDQAKEKARTIVDTFRKFINENKNEVTALQLIYGKPYSRRYLTYEEIESLAQAIQKPPYHLNPDLVWKAYEQLDRAKVRRAGPQKLLTNIISLLRFAIGETDILEPFPEVVNRHFESWLVQQEQLGRKFTPAQRSWLEMIKQHIATSGSISMDDFELSPFYEKGGAVRADRLFEHELDKLLEELNEALVA